GGDRLPLGVRLDLEDHARRLRLLHRGGGGHLRLAVAVVVVRQPVVDVRTGDGGAAGLRGVEVPHLVLDRERERTPTLRLLRLRGAAGGRRALGGATSAAALIVAAATAGRGEQGSRPAQPGQQQRPPANATIESDWMCHDYLPSPVHCAARRAAYPLLPRSRGSKASRIASPSRLKPS